MEVFSVFPVCFLSLVETDKDGDGAGMDLVDAPSGAREVELAADDDGAPSASSALWPWRFKGPRLLLRFLNLAKMLLPLVLLLIGFNGSSKLVSDAVRTASGSASGAMAGGRT